MKIATLILTSLLTFPAMADTAPVFPDQVKVGTKDIFLNGVGTRTATLFAVKVYDAAFYTPTSVTQAELAISGTGPMRLDIRYLRNFSLEDTVDAWKYQFRESSGFTNEELKTELDQLTSFQSEIKKGDVQRFDLDEKGTHFSINGELKGTIAGEKFRKAFLTLFFGKNPPTRELQRALLKGRTPPNAKVTSR